jgi:hypothetical protein
MRRIRSRMAKGLVLWTLSLVTAHDSPRACGGQHTQSQSDVASP